MIPLFSREAEDGLLGALMIDSSVRRFIECDLKPAHFYQEWNRWIYETICWLLDEKRRESDLVTVYEAMQAKGFSNEACTWALEIGGAAFSTAGVKRYAEIIVEKANLRALQAAASEIIESLSGPGAAAEKIDAAQKAVMAVSDRAMMGERKPQRMSALMPGYLDALGARWEKSGGGVPTGFPAVDKRVNGGLDEGWLVILAGRPGMGKTSKALQISINFASNGVPSLICSQEMQSGQLIDRAVAIEGRLDLSKIISGEMTEEDHEKLQFGLSRINDIPLFIDEQGSLRIEDVRRKARQVKRDTGGSLGLVVIDFLQLMVGDGENRTREMTAITGALKSLAKELRCPIIALSQLNREVEKRPNKRPVMADLRESGSIEQDADVIWALYRDEVYNPDSMDKGLAELLWLKNRQGAPGGMTPLLWTGPHVRFDSMFGEMPSASSERTGSSGKQVFKNAGFPGDF
jgi:replicative DNA helicase